jgi:hypothetical protein
MDDNDDLPLITSAELLLDVPGGADLLRWFDGRVPTFHDAEVLTLALDRKAETDNVSIYTFELTPDLDEKGFFVLTKHVAVCFQLSGITNLELTDFNHQNVIDGLLLSRTESGGFRLELKPCWGLSGFIEAQTVTIGIKPGKP